MRNQIGSHLEAIRVPGTCPLTQGMLSSLSPLGTLGCSIVPIYEGAVMGPHPPSQCLTPNPIGTVPQGNASKAVLPNCRASATTQKHSSTPTRIVGTARTMATPGKLSSKKNTCKCNQLHPHSLLFLARNSRPCQRAFGIVAPVPRKRLPRAGACAFQLQSCHDRLASQGHWDRHGHLRHSTPPLCLPQGWAPALALGSHSLVEQHWAPLLAVLPCLSLPAISSRSRGGECVAGDARIPVRLANLGLLWHACCSTPVGRHRASGAWRTLRPPGTPSADKELHPGEAQLHEHMSPAAGSSEAPPVCTLTGLNQQPL